MLVRPSAGGVCVGHGQVSDLWNPQRQAAVSGPLRSGLLPLLWAVARLVGVSWLRLLCGAIAQIRRTSAMLHPGDGGFAAAAFPVEAAVCTLDRELQFELQDAQAIEIFEITPRHLRLRRVKGDCVAPDQRAPLWQRPRPGGARAATLRPCHHRQGARHDTVRGLPARGRRPAPYRNSPPVLWLLRQTRRRAAHSRRRYGGGCRRTLIGCMSRPCRRRRASGHAPRTCLELRQQRR